ncbi:hypothetical protein BDZ94DRAFT_1315007 [Collybia nuda]|uniref:Uncharacterized protein n=1 Tax=Collybia nuda TaxID=64659 RepID=A0A9P5XU22_9AGAR|nr:hypothetical protein BDZ94DRAFT_1315007 [Collybia nuda]
MVLPANFSPDLLRTDSSLLLHAKCTKDEITGVDGRVGAAVNQGRHIVTSPNSKNIFYPPLGGDRNVFLRNDLLFADDDYLQWPQSFIPEVPHLACIPRPPASEMPVSIMWKLPDRTAFIVEDHGILRGIGKLSPQWLLTLKQVSGPLINRCKEPLFGEVVALTAQLLNTLQDILHRLEHISTNFRSVQLGVRATQRVYLELLACLDYMEIYRPRMDESTHSRFAVSNRIGTFTTDVNICNRMYRAGIPVWLIRPSNSLHSIHIASVAPVQMPNDILKLEPAIRPSYPAIYTGGSIRDKYLALANHSLGYLVYPDPFGSIRAHGNVNPPLPPPGLSKKELRSKRYSPYANRKKDPAALSGGRNKFEDPVSPFLPPAIPLWRRALENVNLHSAKFQYPDLLPTDLGYVFPEPASLLSIQSPDRQKGFFCTWLRYRHALIYRVSSGGFDTQPMPNTVWRALLNHDFVVKSTTGDTQTRSQKHREMAKDFLKSCLDVEGVELGDPDGSRLQVSWNGKTFEDLGKDDFEEIIWELAELNFRFELLALDSRATNESSASRQELVLKCLPRTSLGASLLVADLGSANQGLAGTSWADRGDYVLALRKLMSSWRGEVPPIIKMEKVFWSLEEAAELEEVMTRHYCTTFYNYFRRAPIVPRRLSHIVSRYEDPPSAITIIDPRPNILYDKLTLSSRIP